MEVDRAESESGDDPFSFSLGGLDGVPSDDEGHRHSVHDLDGQRYLDEVVDSMKANDVMMVDELRCLLRSISGGSGDALCLDILRHGTFLRVLTNESLLDKDLSVSRIALLILHELAVRHSGSLAGDRTLRVFESINKLLCCHRKPLIKRHTIRLLSVLAEAASWNLSPIEKTQMKWRINQFGKNEGLNDAVRRTLQRINAKLDGI